MTLDPPTFYTAIAVLALLALVAWWPHEKEG